MFKKKGKSICSRLTELKRALEVKMDELDTKYLDYKEKMDLALSERERYQKMLSALEESEDC